ncbi:ATP-binding protein [Streptosporangium amethystogenes subsp. fukuiense]|uniref:ATP-binding protein n=1 Tax=Streptosporangium amethystogenes subsp. fukuiense TaxID=698418 RepID=A0ABW2TAZ4_9ACTN
MRRRPELACRRGPAAEYVRPGRPVTTVRLRRLLHGLGEPAARAVRAARVRRASWTLSPHVSSTPMARRLVRAQLTDWGYDGESDIAELLVSELFTNALRHGRGAPIITLSLREGTLRCEVEDESPAPLQVREAPGTDENGRGLLLVDTLSRSWGTGRTRTGRPGKTVWFELPAHPAYQAF